MVDNSVKRVCDYLICDVPFPPSINELYKAHKIGKRCSVGRSSKYKNYVNKVFEPWWLSVRRHGRVYFGDDVMIWVVLCPPRSNCDIDNYLKCFIDCLEHVEAIPDDKVVCSIRVEKGPRVSRGLMRAFIANHEHWKELQHTFVADYTQWKAAELHAHGKILKQPDSLLFRRAGFAAPAQYPAEPVPEDTASPF